MGKTDRAHWRARFLAYAPLVIWIAVILILGSGPGASAQTSRFLRPLLEFLFPGAAEETLQLYHGYIRKSAHFTEYGILAFFALRAFARLSLWPIRHHIFLSALVVVVTTASLDEFLQSMNSSRTGSLWDVLLDTAGGAFALLILRLWTRPVPLGQEQV